MQRRETEEAGDKQAEEEQKRTKQEDKKKSKKTNTNRMSKAEGRHPTHERASSRWGNANTEYGCVCFVCDCVEVNVEALSRNVTDLLPPERIGSVRATMVVLGTVFLPRCILVQLLADHAKLQNAPSSRVGAGKCQPEAAHEVLPKLPPCKLVGLHIVLILGAGVREMDIAFTAGDWQA